MKDPDTCTLFEIYSAFASQEETLMIRKAYANGIGWGDMKGQLFEYLNDYLSPARKRYDEIITDPAYIESELQKGAAKARAQSEPFMQRLRSAVGIMSLVGDLGAKQASTKAKKELTQEEQAKVNAGKAKAMEIAKQRADQEARQLALKVDDLINASTLAMTLRQQVKSYLQAYKRKLMVQKRKPKKHCSKPLNYLSNG